MVTRILVPSAFLLMNTLALHAATAPPSAIDNAATYPMLTREEFRPDPARDVADMRRVKQRLYDHYLATAGRKAEKPVPELIASLTPEGAWPDLDYTTRAKMFFPPFPHLHRLAAMAVAYRTPSDPLHGAPELRSAILRGLDHWVRANPQTDHHWFIEIGAPMELLPTLILVESELSPEQVRAVLPLLRTSDRGGVFRYGPNEATGANLMWVARMNLEAALLEEDAFETARAARRFEQEIKITEREGVQPDFSFTQHGHQLYASGYGGAYAADAAHVAAYLAGTRFAFDPVRVQVIADYVVEGQQWMMRGYHWISGPKGREISRKTRGKPPASSVAETLAAVLPGRRDALLAVGKRMRGAVPPTENALSGNRHFWRVDLMTHHRPAWMAAVRMASRRVIGTESGNTENLLGHHLADGVLEVMLTGEEYRGIYPLWNWRQLPGTTVAQTDGPLPLHDWGKNARGTTDFVGGVSDGRVGLAVFDFDRDGVRVRKAWFFLDDRIVAAGAGLSASTEAPVVTSVNQCWRRGPVLVSRAGAAPEPAGDGTTSLTGPAWVWHDGIGYAIPEEARAVLTLERRTGSWKTINATQPDDPVTGDVFTLLLDHGPRPSGVPYHYAIFPAVTGAAPPPAELRLANNPGVQALFDPGSKSLFGAFWSPGGFAEGEAAGGGVGVSADRACLVIVSPTHLSVADPSARGGVVNITVTRDGKERRHEITLSGGAYAGQTVRIPLDAPPP